jgi:hypothetical protein
MRIRRRGSDEIRPFDEQSPTSVFASDRQERVDVKKRVLVEKRVSVGV